MSDTELDLSPRTPENTPEDWVELISKMAVRDWYLLEVKRLKAELKEATEGVHRNLGGGPCWRPSYAKICGVINTDTQVAVKVFYQSNGCEGWSFLAELDRDTQEWKYTSFWKGEGSPVEWVDPCVTELLENTIHIGYRFQCLRPACTSTCNTRFYGKCTTCRKPGGYPQVFHEELEYEEDPSGKFWEDVWPQDLKDLMEELRNR